MLWSQCGLKPQSTKIPFYSNSILMWCFIYKTAKFQNLVLTSTGLTCFWICYRASERCWIEKWPRTKCSQNNIIQTAYFIPKIKNLKFTEDPLILPQFVQVGSNSWNNVESQKLYLTPWPLWKTCQGCPTASGRSWIKQLPLIISAQNFNLTGAY